MKDVKITISEALSKMIENGQGMKTVMTRDQEALQKFNIGASELTEFDNKLDKLIFLGKEDTNLRGLKAEAIQNRNQYRYLLNNRAQDIKQVCEAFFGFDSSIVARLGVNNLHKVNTVNFMMVIASLERVLLENLAELIPIGITQSDIDDLASLRLSMQDAQEEATQKRILRESRSVERNKLKQELTELMAKYSRLGKSLWLRSSTPDKAKEYFLS